MTDKPDKQEEAKALREKVGKRINQIRTALGKTQKQLAKDAGLTQSTIAQFETGERLPSTTALHSIAAALGISMERLLSGGDVLAEDDGKEFLLERLTQKARELSRENILTLNRMVEQLPPERKEDK